LYRSLLDIAIVLLMNQTLSDIKLMVNFLSEKICSTNVVQHHLDMLEVAMLAMNYEGTHGGIGYGDRNADVSRSLEFADGLNLVICNTLFMKQESHLVTYAAGPVKSTV